MEFGNYKHVLYILIAASIVLLSHVFYIFWRKKSSPSGIKILGSRKIILAKKIIIIISIMLAAFTLLEPRWGERTRNVDNEGSDVVIALDVSISMLAEDIKPSRLERAKSAVKWVAESIAGGRIALILFAGDSFLLCPLTSDIAAFLMFTDSASPDSVRLMGTDISKALTAGQKIFEKKRRTSNTFVLITDGEDNEGRALSAVKPLKELGVSIYTVGVGKTEGDLIPYGSKEQGESKNFFDDRSGKPVRTKKNQDLLQKLANETNGKYIDITEDISEMRHILDTISEQTKEKYATKIIKEKEEKFMIFAFLLIILLSVEIMMPEKKYISETSRRENQIKHSLAYIMALISMLMGKFKSRKKV
jgi:Ca-activated chloride channel family protein